MMRGKSATVCCLLEEQFQQVNFLHASLQEQAHVATEMVVCERARGWGSMQERQINPPLSYLTSCNKDVSCSEKNFMRYNLY